MLCHRAHCLCGMQGEEAAHHLVSAPRSSQPANSTCLPEAPQPPPPAKDAVPQPQQQAADAEDKPQTLPSEAPPTSLPMSTMITIEQAASKAQHYQEQAATAERDGQQAGAQSPAACEKACVMDIPQVPANNGTPSGTAVTQEPLPQQVLCEPSSTHEALDWNMESNSSEAGGAGALQIEMPMAEAPEQVLQQQVSEPELEPIATEVHGLQQYPVHANDTANMFSVDPGAVANRQQLMRCSRQAVTPTKHSQRSCWHRYGRYWRCV